MTEIPEHLLKRSKQRKAEATAEGASTAVATTGATAPATADAASAAGGGLTATKAPAAPAAAPLPVDSPEVAASKNRKKAPFWAVAALVGLGGWAYLYTYTLSPPTRESAALSAGEAIYSSSCASCHGVSGGGGVGPAFTDGAVELTFPNYEDHAAWVHGGADSAEADGSYGDPDRPEGQHNTGMFAGVMPAFPNLSEEEILEVVRYEREVLSGYGCEPLLAAATGEECAAGTENPDAPTEAAAP